MERIRFNENVVKSMIGKVGEKIADTEIKQLQLWVGKTGMTFYVVMKHDGRQLFIKLGNPPIMTAMQARVEAQKKVAEILNHECQSQSEGRMITAGEAIDEYIAMKSSESNRKATKCVLNRFSLLRNTKLSMLKVDDVRKVHEAMKDTPVAANRAVKYFSSAISRAIRNHRLNIANPIVGIKLYQETPRERYITKDESPDFMDALEKTANTKLRCIQSLAILMMLYTGARKSNVLKMRFDEIDSEGVWTIPKEKFKGGRKSHSIKLGRRELEIVEALRPLTKQGYVFERNGKPMSDVKKTMQTICKLAGLSNLHLHDLRRTLGTWMLSSGSPIAVVSKKLGHSSIRTTESVYAHMLPDVASDATEKALDEMLGYSEDGNKSE